MEVYFFGYKSFSGNKIKAVMMGTKFKTTETEFNEIELDQWTTF